MTQDKHTPGRFVVKGRTGSYLLLAGSLYRIADETGQYVGFLPSWESVDTEAAEAEANARRVVAAWNACDGISTAALEDGVVAQMLGSLQLALPFVRNDNAAKVIRAAIARATGAA